MDAVKSENESWNTFEACEEVPYNSIVEGASVIPLGELFTIKRAGDGLRWFCSAAATCGMLVKGWDATNGYRSMHNYLLTMGIRIWSMRAWPYSDLN